MSLFKRIFLIISVLCLGGYSAFAQVPNTPIEVKEGKSYYAHIVQKGETIYGLSRTYKTTDKAIFSANPGSEQGIKLGQVLYIPVTASKTDRKHNVIKGETLYAISRKYEVTVDDIVRANAGIEGGLKAGMVLIIPGTNVENNTETPDIRDMAEDRSEIDRKSTTVLNPIAISPDIIPAPAECLDNKNTKLEYNIAVLIPFGTGAVSENKQARIAYQFYSGVKLAMKKYAPIKANIKWNFFNTGSKSTDEELKKIVLKPEFKKSDLIIGPLYTSEMKPVLEYSKANKVPMISPFSRGEDILQGNPYVFKASPSEDSYVSAVARFLDTKYKNGKVILLNTGLKKDSIFYKSLRDTLVLKYRFDSISANRNLVYLNKGGNVAAFIKKDVPNICVYPTNKEISMNSFLSGVNKIGKNNDFSVLGDESWFSFRNFDIEHLNNCKIAVPVLYRTFSWDSTYAGFIHSFKEEYNSEPEFYAYRGYELSCLAVDMLEKYGSLVAPCAIYDRNKYLITPFKWNKIQGGGYENSGLGIMILNNYSIRYESY